MWRSEQMHFLTLDFYKFTEQISDARHVLVWERQRSVLSLGCSSKSVASEWGVGQSEDVNSLSLQWGCETWLPTLHIFLWASSSADARWSGNTALNGFPWVTLQILCHHFVQKSQSGRAEVESKATVYLKGSICFIGLISNNFEEYIALKKWRFSVVMWGPQTFPRTAFPNK